MLIRTEVDGILAGEREKNQLPAKGKGGPSERLLLIYGWWEIKMNRGSTEMSKGSSGDVSRQRGSRQNMWEFMRDGVPNYTS